MMPSFSKSEVENSIEEAIHASAERQKADNRETATEIITAINSFAESYNAQRIKHERKNKVKAFIDITTMLLLFGTAVFTGSAWWVFREQLHQMERAYAPIKESAEAAKASAEAAKASAEAARAAVELSTRPPKGNCAPTWIFPISGSTSSPAAMMLSLSECWS
jgi:hypothetical protein